MDQSTEERITTPPVSPTSPQKSGGFWKDVITFAIIALVVILPIRLYVVQPFVVDGQSMDPTFETGNYLLVNQLSYHFGNPERGQVIIFKYPKNPSVYYIKRVIGLPGETVIINGSAVTIKNAAHPDGFTLDEPYIDPRNAGENYMTATLGPDQYFVMGDNRAGSSDSRSWGPVPRNLIVGTPLIQLFPLTQIRVLPGDYKEAN